MDAVDKRVLIEALENILDHPEDLGATVQLEQALCVNRACIVFHTMRPTEGDQFCYSCPMRKPLEIYGRVNGYCPWSDYLNKTQMLPSGEFAKVSWRLHTSPAEKMQAAIEMLAMVKAMA